MIHTKSPMTARELLVSIAGDEHADHTVVRKEKRIGLLRMWCSCGWAAELLDVEFNRLALRNVSEVAS